MNFARRLDGIHALTDGEIRVDVAEHRDELLDIRAGKYSFEEVRTRALELDRLRSNISLLASNDAFAPPRLVEIKPEDCMLAFTFLPSGPTQATGAPFAGVRNGRWLSTVTLISFGEEVITT